MCVYIYIYTNMCVNIYIHTHVCVCLGSKNIQWIANQNQTNIPFSQVETGTHRLQTPLLNVSQEKQGLLPFLRPLRLRLHAGINSHSLGPGIPLGPQMPGISTEQIKDRSAAKVSFLGDISPSNMSCKTNNTKIIEGNYYIHHQNCYQKNMCGVILRLVQTAFNPARWLNCSVQRATHMLMPTRQTSLGSYLLVVLWTSLGGDHVQQPSITYVILCT